MSNNKIILNGCVNQFRLSNELNVSDSETFEIFSLNQTTKHHGLSFEDIRDSIVDGGNDGGIDSIIILVDDINIKSIDDLQELRFSKKTTTHIIITQCKKENSFKEVTLDKLITTLPELFNLEKNEADLLVRFNQAIVEKGIIARETWKFCAIKGGSISIEYNYCCCAEMIEVNATFKDKMEQLKALTASIFKGCTVKYSNFSSEELLLLYQKQMNERLSINFKESPLSTNFGKNGIGYVGTVFLNDYKLFLTDEDGAIREDLFENNIRHFQGQVDVNRKIKATIENDNNEDFWWLNNGITIIASNPTQLGKSLSIDNVQIVNGLQTSYTIYNCVNLSLKDERSVLVKVIINEDKAAIDHIIASTNSQNPVAASLLRATDDVQRGLELFFSNAGYYYDRRKNYYKNLGKPANRIFSIQTTAQCIESIIFSNPYTARSKPTTLIKDDQNYFRIFNKNTNYQAYLICCLMLKKTTDFWSQIGDQTVKNKISNFKLHLARVAVSVVLGMASYDLDSVSTFNIDDYDESKFDLAVTLMVEAIDQFQLDNPGANLINMAKSKSFSDETISYLEDTLWLL